MARKRSKLNKKGRWYNADGSHELVDVDRCNGKVCYLTAEEAYTQLRRIIKWGDNPNKKGYKPKRYYQCSTCDQFHLTSMGTWPGDNRSGRRTSTRSRSRIEGLPAKKRAAIADNKLARLQRMRQQQIKRSMETTDKG